MKTASLVFVSFLALIPADSSQACGFKYRGIKARCRPANYPVVSYAPAAYPVAAPVYATAAPAPVYAASAPSPAPAYTPPAPASAPPASVGVQPTYNYRADPGDYKAYYYAYNDNGELIVKQWMDWVFRGGRQAGLPAPPLPIIGRLGRN